MNFTPSGNNSFDSNSSQNYTGIGVVIVLHIVLIYALVEGLARKVVDVLQAPVEMQLVKEVLPPPIVKKPIPPKLVIKKDIPPPPKIQPTFVPKAEVVVANPSPPVIAEVTNTPAPPQPAPVPVAKPVHVAVSTSSRTGCSAPQYPDEAASNDESGTVTLSLLIGENGKVIDSKVLSSSGYKDLDRAAQKGLSLCTFQPATTDGQPVQSWTKLQYVWKLSE